MLKTRITLALCMLAPAFGQTTVTYSFNGFPLPIYNDSANIVTVANVYVPRDLKMSKVTAQVQIQYPNTGDLNVYLFSPSGTRTILLEHDCSVANIDTTFDDSAPSLWKDFCPTEAGRGPFRPDQPLSNFNGDDSSFGVWRLAVENNSSNSRSGWINTVSLTITGAAQSAPTARPTSIVNAADVRQHGTIAPGELVSIYGLALGPDTAVSAPSGNLPTSLGGSSVTVNGAAAPVSFASLYRIDFQAPFSLQAGSTATVQISTSSGQSLGIPLSVVGTAPAVYTESVDGTGQVMATNQDGTLNSTTNPAAAGTTVSVFSNGLGVTSPAVPEGTAPPNSPLSTVSGVTALIGGKTATVQFAGLVPTVPGLYQVNVQVPASLTTGAQELLIFVSGEPTQKGTTIQVK